MHGLTPPNIATSALHDTAAVLQSITGYGLNGIFGRDFKQRLEIRNPVSGI